MMYDTPPLLLPLSPLLQSYMNPLTELAWAPSGILVWPNRTGMDGMHNYLVHGSVKLKDIIGLKVHPQYVFK